MRLKKLLLRYYPPGIMLEYEKGGKLRNKSINLQDLNESDDTVKLVEEISATEPLITEKSREVLKRIVERLKEKIIRSEKATFEQSRVLKAHMLPLTNVAFNKSGSQFITGSYDRTCKIWETETGKEIHTIEGHRNVVYAIAFNLPYSDRISTGSFDKTARIWNAETGQCLQTFEGHNAEVVCLQFSPNSLVLATGSMDTMTKVWDIETGNETATLSGHTAEVIALQFSQGGCGSNNHDDGRILLTGSFDYTACLWDLRSATRVAHLIGHTAEVSAACCSFNGYLVATASMDKTVRVWDARTGRQLYILSGHDDEVLDANFNLNGRQLASASADGSAILWDTHTTGLDGNARIVAKLEGHEGEVSKVCFNPRGTTLMTASADKTVRLWNTEDGSIRQVLVGHSDEIFSCAFNYEGDRIITGSKDNTCRIWQ